VLRLCHLPFHELPSTEIYTLSLHDALPISSRPKNHLLHLPASLGLEPPPHPHHGRHPRPHDLHLPLRKRTLRSFWPKNRLRRPRSEEHTSELQSRENLVCRLLLEKKNTTRL